MPQCVEQFGRLDVLVNVAGAHQMRHTLAVTDEEWDHDLAVNLNGPFYLCRAALPHLLVMRVASPRGMSSPAEVAEVIAFLASDAAAAVHGAVYLADNGKTAG